MNEQGSSDQLSENNWNEEWKQEGSETPKQKKMSWKGLWIAVGIMILLLCIL